MSAQRIQIPLIVQTVREIETGEKTKVKVVSPVHEADVVITRRDGNPVKVYETETGSEISNELKTDSDGQIKAWVPEGPYLITAKGGDLEIAPVSYTFDAVTGRGVEHIADEVVTQAELIAALQTFLIPIGSVLLWGGKSNQIPEGFFNCNGEEKLTATYPTLSAKLGTKYGTAEAGKFKLPKGEIENAEKQSFILIVRHD